LVWLTALTLTQADGVPQTCEWVNLYSTNSTFDGQPIPAGTTVAVFRADGTKCGEFDVTVDGWYGLMPCYGEQKSPEQSLRVGSIAGSSAAAEASAAAGDHLSFTVDGFPAEAEVITFNGKSVPESTPVTWSANGDLWQVDLRVRSCPVGGRSMEASCLRLIRPATAMVAVGSLLALLLLLTMVVTRRAQAR
jgi:hypothetical protein